jgi:putative membrane protein
VARLVAGSTLFLVAVPPALAHQSALEHSEAPLWLAQGVFALGWMAYVRGTLRSAPPLARHLGFHFTMLLAGLSLFGPFDAWAAESTAWHMVQHMMLMVVVTPLLVLARPLPQWRAAVGPMADRVWRGLMGVSRRPMLCALLHAAAIWFWHAPAPYVAAVQHTGLHVLEHACFLFTGWLFWWSVLRPGRHRVLLAAMALLFTATHTGMLGALLTFAREPLYAAESGDLADQQLAGLIMWVPGGTVYLLAAAWAGFRWLGGLERRSGAAALARARLG